MLNQHVIPSAKKAGFSPDELVKGVKMLEEGLHGVHAEEDESKQADLARDLRLVVSESLLGSDSDPPPRGVTNPPRVVSTEGKQADLACCSRPSPSPSSSTRTNQMQEAWVCSRDGPIRHRKPHSMARCGHCRIDR
eukprot:6297976-Pyramimonas_sp.AAC.1